MPKLKFKEAILAAFYFASPAYSFTTVQLSTSSPKGLENAFLAATTTQFTATVVSNPFFANTYQVLLQDYNPGYTKPVTMQELLNSLVTVDSYTYVYGWADGESYDRTQTIGHVAQKSNLCASATNFQLIESGTATFNSATCHDVLGTILNDLYLLEFSSPTVVPGF